MKSPIFIFSLPRSGSTLIQRVLSGHLDIATTAEPWFLLPLVYAVKESGGLTEYNQNTSSRAVTDFINTVGVEKYNNRLSSFMSSLYQECCSNGEMYFIDKTPRYYLIIDEIVSIFPDAKVIFLFRSPLHIIGSMIETFSSGGLGRLYPYNIDLSTGFHRLSQGYEKYKHTSYALKYEDFVSNPALYTKELCDYLEVNYQADMLDKLPAREMNGKMGDPIERNLKRGVDTSSMNKWENSCSGMYRKLVVKNYLSKMTDEDFLVQGYKKGDIIQDVASLEGHCKALAKDFLQYKLGCLITLLKLNIFFGKSSRKWTVNTYLG